MSCQNAPTWRGLVEDVMARPDVSYFIKNAVFVNCQRDPLDALMDAEDLVHLLRRRIELESPELANWLKVEA